MNFDHFVVTTFNVDHGAVESPGLDPEWLEPRFELFERFCLPSVGSQEHTGFTWLVFFDERTPERFRGRIEELRERTSFVPIFVPGRWHVDAVRAAIAEHRRPGTQFLITSRLDNDDSLARDYIARVQSLFAEQHSLFINFPSGYTWKDGRLYALRNWSNPFATLIERWADERPRTVLGIEHTEIVHAADVAQIRSEPMWLQVIHGRNIANRVAGVRVPLDHLAARFEIDPPPTATPEAMVPRLADRIRTGITWGLPDRLRTVVRNRRYTG